LSVKHDATVISLAEIWHGRVAASEACTLRSMVGPGGQTFGRNPMSDLETDVADVSHGADAADDAAAEIAFDGEDDAEGDVEADDDAEAHEDGDDVDEASDA
jgi:hypothetical protein